MNSNRNHTSHVSLDSHTNDTDGSNLATRNRTGRISRMARNVAAVAAVSAAAVAVTGGTALAKTTSTSGASVTTVLSCMYDGANVDYLNIGFDYVKLWGYDSELGWAAGTWQPMNNNIGTVGITVSAGSTYAVYAQFADRTGPNTWSYGGEWVANSSRTNYWCQT
jgi:hypothetical protein